MIGLNVGDAPAALRATVLAMKRADKETRRDISARMRSTMNPAWRSEVTGNTSGMEGRFLSPGARIAAGNPPTLVAANSKRGVGRGDYTPTENWQGFEFGANRNESSTVTSSKGTTYKRKTKRHLPQKDSKGRVLYPAVARILPRVAAFWAQSVIRAFMDAAEKR